MEITYKKLAPKKYKQYVKFFTSHRSMLVDRKLVNLYDTEHMLNVIEHRKTNQYSKLTKVAKEETLKAGEYWKELILKRVNNGTSN